MRLLVDNHYLVQDKDIEAAIRNDQASFLAIFIAHGVEISEELINEAMLAERPVLLKMLVESGRIFDWTTLFTKAIKENNLSVVQFVVAKSLISEAESYEGMKLAIKLKRTEIYQYLKDFLF